MTPAEVIAFETALGKVSRLLETMTSKVLHLDPTWDVLADALTPDEYRVFLAFTDKMQQHSLKEVQELLDHFEMEVER